MLCVNFGNRISFLRKEKGMSRDELSAKAHISTNYLGMIERGERQQLSIKVIEDLSLALGISLSELFRGIEDADNQECLNIELANDTYHKEILDTCYPREHSYYRVSSLLKFLLYLPLIDPVLLADSLSRIGGSFCDREEYVLKNINYCIGRIPPSPALSFVQAEESKLSRSLAIRKTSPEKLTLEERETLSHWNPEGQAEYVRKISDIKELYNILQTLKMFYLKDKLAVL